MSSPHGGPAERSCPRHSFHLKELSQSSSRHRRPIPSTGSFAFGFDSLAEPSSPPKEGCRLRVAVVDVLLLLDFASSP